MTTITIAQRITKPSATRRNIAGCIYGKGGVGKTTLLGTLPGKGLVLDVPVIEGGVFVLSDYDDRIDCLTIRQWNELEEALAYLREAKHGYQWVAVDTASAMQKLAQRKTIRERTLDSDPYSLSQQDYGKMGNLMSEFFFRLRALPLMSFILAQERSRANEELAVERGPDVQPSALAALLPPMTFVGRLYIVETENDDGSMAVERRLRLGPSDTVTAKARTLSVDRQVPPVIRNPHLGKLIAYLLGLSSEPLDEAPDDSSALVIG